MVEKSAFIVISVCKTILLKLACKNYSEISDTIGGEPIFQVWVGGKRGNQNFSQILGGGAKLYTL